MSHTFNPTVDGQVQQLAPGPTSGTVYVAGDFTKINGRGPNHLQLLDVQTGLAVPSFRAPSTNGGIETMDLLPDNRLFIGGFFNRIGGVSHGQLATLNATTGALDPFLDLGVAGHHNDSGSGAQAPVGPRESGVTPAGDRLVVVGNFRTVGGLDRDQIVMLDLTGPSAAVSTTWYTTEYTPVCSPRAFDSYMRDIEISPDGSFFVVASTGGPHAGTLCDTAARFETYAVGTSLAPTWTDTSGGDTLWGVEITRSAVYVGGHNRWMNNPSGSDRAAQGAVPRPGLAALDPETGIPLKWNPGRHPRGEAAYEIYETDAGLWVVSDTDWIGNRRYQRARIAFFPYDEGYDTASKSSGSLPGNVYVGAPLSATNVLYRVNAGGATLASVDSGPDWASDNGATSPFHNTGSSTATFSALSAANLVNVPASTPRDLDLGAQRPARRRHQAVQLQPERRPGRQQEHDEVLRHRQRRHGRHRLRPRAGQPAGQRDRDPEQLGRLELHRGERHRLRRQHGRLANQHDHGLVRLEQRPRCGDDRPDPVLRADRRLPLPPLLRRGELR